VANAVISDREVSRLFDDKSGPYRDLVKESVHGQYVLRCVEVMEAVTAVLEDEAKTSEGIRSETPGAAKTLETRGRRECVESYSS
jgi:hypothetical protein